MTIHISTTFYSRVFALLSNIVQNTIAQANETHQTQVDSNSRGEGLGWLSWMGIFIYLAVELCKALRCNSLTCFALLAARCIVYMAVKYDDGSINIAMQKTREVHSAK